MKRADAIAYIRIAGYHNDQATAQRIYLENKLSRAALNTAFAEGANQKERGISCTCYDCRKEHKEFK